MSREARYWILGLALLVSALCGVAAFEWVSPVGMIHRELIFGPGLGLLAIAAILLLDLFVAQRGWCGSLCPLGAFYALVGRFSLLRMGFDTGRCDRCGDCVAGLSREAGHRFPADGGPRLHPLRRVHQLRALPRGLPSRRVSPDPAFRAERSEFPGERRPSCDPERSLVPGW